jgi:hypothetical protein
VPGSRVSDAPETVGEETGAAVTVGSAAGNRVGVAAGGVVAVGMDVVVGVFAVVVVAVGVCVAAATTSVGVAGGCVAGRGVGPQAARTADKIKRTRQAAGAVARFLAPRRTAAPQDSRLVFTIAFSRKGRGQSHELT